MNSIDYVNSEREWRDKIKYLIEENIKLKKELNFVKSQFKNELGKKRRLSEKYGKLIKELKDLKGRTNYEVFIKVEDKLNEIVKWSLLKNRKPSCINWTSSPERNIARIIENLQFELKEKIK